MKVSNLDAACAALGHELGTIVAQGKTSKDTENSITKALGVLEEQGVYALFLYLHAREKDLRDRFSEKLMKFLRSEDVRLVPEQENSEPFGALQELAKSLDDLLFARGLLHQVLVYARYHAKAAQTEGTGGSGSGGGKTKPKGAGRSHKGGERSNRGGDRPQGETGK